MDWFLSLPMTWKIFAVYVAVISVLSVLVCVYDKLFSKLNNVKFRVPEKSLFVFSALGGGVAMFVTMLIIRHKTKHVSFMVGIPLIILLQATLIWVLIHFGILPI